jgi:hypothetical protein
VPFEDENDAWRGRVREQDASTRPGTFELNGVIC